MLDCRVPDPSLELLRGCRERADILAEFSQFVLGKARLNQHLCHRPSRSPRVVCEHLKIETLHQFNDVIDDDAVVCYVALGLLNQPLLAPVLDGHAISPGLDVSGCLRHPVAIEDVVVLLAPEQQREGVDVSRRCQVQRRPARFARELIEGDV